MLGSLSLPVGASKAAKSRLRDPNDLLDPVNNKERVINPAPHGPRRDAEAVGDLLDRKKFLHLTVPEVWLGTRQYRLRKSDSCVRAL
jgi:hypothetical protein